MAEKLFTIEQLRMRTQNPDLTEDDYEAVHDLVLDSLLGEVGSDNLDLDDLPHGVSSIAVELGQALAAGNLASKTVGPVAETYQLSHRSVNPELTHKQRIKLRRIVGMNVNFGVQTGVANEPDDDDDSDDD